MVDVYIFIFSRLYGIRKALKNKWINKSPPPKQTQKNINITTQMNLAKNI